MCSSTSNDFPCCSAMTRSYHCCCMAFWACSRSDCVMEVLHYEALRCCFCSLYSWLICDPLHGCQQRFLLQLFLLPCCYPLWLQFARKRWVFVHYRCCRLQVHLSLPGHPQYDV